MHLHFLDPYHSRVSNIHRLDARVKLVLALAVIATAALAPVGAWPVYILLWVMVASGEILSELGLVFFLKRSLFAIPFVFAALPLLFSGIPPFLGELHLGGRVLLVSQPGLERFVSIGLKSWLSIQAALWLAATTPFPALLLAMRTLGFPRVLVAIISFMWRYLFVLVDEAYRLNRARLSRSGWREGRGSKPGGTMRWRAQVTGGMVGNLFLRALERGDRVYMAMLSRGYDGEIRSLPQPKLATGERIVLALISLFLILLVLSGWLFWR